MDKYGVFSKVVFGSLKAIFQTGTETGSDDLNPHELRFKSKSWGISLGRGKLELGLSLAKAVVRLNICYIKRLNTHIFISKIGIVR